MRRHDGGRPDERPFILVEKARGALRIAALDAAAARLDLRLGMGLAEARARVADLSTQAADPAGDQEILARAAAIAEMFTPLVALRDKAGLILDITGCAHLFGGEAGLRRQAQRRMAALGLSAKATIATTPDAAWAFARFTSLDIAAPGAGEELARALPLAALDCPAETAIALSRAGFRILGDLADRPANLLVARFGPEIAATLRRLLGREDIRLTPLRPLPECLAERHFPEPLALMDGLLAALERLARDVMASLERRGEGGRRFEASFFRADGNVRRLSVETAEATRDARSLMRLLTLRIETLADPLDPGFGFDALRLAVTRSETLAAHQPALAGEAGGEPDPTAFADLVNRLVARFGRENVLRFIAGDSHDPARAGAILPCLSAPSASPFPVAEPGRPPARPLTLFAHPQPVEALAEVPDGPPLRFRWRRVLHEVARAEGPERIAPEWWRGGDRPPATRDYYRLEDGAGHRFWVFREGFYEDSTARPRWFLHGLFA